MSSCFNYDPPIRKYVKYSIFPYFEGNNSVQYSKMTKDFFSSENSFMNRDDFLSVADNMRDSQEIDDKLNLAAWYLNRFNNIENSVPDCEQEALALYEKSLELYKVKYPRESSSSLFQDYDQLYDQACKQDAHEAIAYLCLNNPRLWKKSESLIYHYAKTFFNEDSTVFNGFSLLIQMHSNESDCNLKASAVISNPDIITSLLLKNSKFQEALDYTKGFWIVEKK